MATEATKNYWEEDFYIEELDRRFADALVRYQVERRNFWLREVPVIFAIGAVVIFSLTWVFLRFGAEGLLVSEVQVWITAFFLLLSGMLAPIFMKKPEAPTRESIAYGLQLNLIGAASQKQKKQAH